jgi:holo-[acyl-carrier protein] synthase
MIGIDIVSIDRFEKFLEKEGALEKFLREDEMALAKNSQSSAALFASKEAISKALGVGIGKECSFKDIRIYKDKRGKPHFTLSKKLIDKFKIVDTSLSISHDKGFAVAVAAIESRESTLSKRLYH